MLKFLVCLVVMVLAGCSEYQTVGAAPDAASTATASSLPMECGDPAAYDVAVTEYAAQYGLDAAWEAYMLEDYQHNCLAFEVARYYRLRGGPVHIGVRYASGAPWADEAAHLALFEEVLGAVYRLPFDVSDNVEGADIVMTLGATVNRGKLGAVWLIHDGIAAHEVGHALGLHHHYSTEAELGTHQHQPLAEENCVMDRTGYELDSACRFDLGVPWGDPGQSAAIAAGIIALNAGGVQ